TNWSQQGYLKASDTRAFDGFGNSVGVASDTVVVGAPAAAGNAAAVNDNLTNSGTSRSGATYVFVRKGAIWTQQAYLKASNAASQDYFGNSVAVSGDTVVVGARWEDSNATGVNGDQSDNSASDSGAAYVFAGLGLGPGLTIVQDGSGGYFLRFTGAPAVRYRLQRAPSVTGPWDTLALPTPPPPGPPRDPHPRPP